MAPVKRSGKRALKRATDGAKQRVMALRDTPSPLPAKRGRPESWQPAA